MNYYLTTSGDVVETTTRFDDILRTPMYTQLNELQYAVAKLMIMGYSRTEIIGAVHAVYKMLPNGENNET